MVELEIMPREIMVVVLTFEHEFHVMVESEWGQKERHFAVLFIGDLKGEQIYEQLAQSYPKEASQQKRYDAFIVPL